MKKVCVVTGTRAEYGLLKPVIAAFCQENTLELQLVVTGTHLSPEYGYTYREIEQDGFIIKEKVEILLSSDTAWGVAKSMGLAVIGFADVLKRLNPDLLVILGDRYEILAVAQAALVLRIPIAHLAGGDVTEGAFDEAIRHSITKMAHLHFVTNEVSARRVRQLGEDPNRIYNVGSTSIDAIRTLNLLSRSELEQAISFKLLDRNILITYHPTTLAKQNEENEFGQLLQALDRLGTGIGLLFTKSNSDTGARLISSMMEDYVSSRSHAAVYSSLGQLRYLSAMKHVDVVLGNSSSGVYEAPALGKPTVNIGDRQKGRLMPESVLNVPVEQQAIYSAIFQAFEMDCAHIRCPYGDGTAAIKIVRAIKQIANCRDLLQKRFHDWE